MTNDAKAVIPIEINLLIPRVTYFEQGSNDKGLVGGLEMLEGRREMVSIQLADYQ